MAIQNILVATDFSEGSEVALERAVELAKAAHATLHVVHGCVAFLAPPPDRTPMPEDWIEAVRARARERLAAIEKALIEQGIETKIHMHHEDAVSAILAEAAAIPADLIVMGTRGLSGFKHLLLGSVAERTLRLAPCPVMTVKIAPRS